MNRKQARRDHITRSNPFKVGRHKQEPKAAGHGGWARKRKTTEDKPEKDTDSAPQVKRRRHIDSFIASQCQLTDSDSQRKTRRSCIS